MNNQKIDLRKAEQKLYSKGRKEWLTLIKVRTGNDFVIGPSAYRLMTDSGKVLRNYSLDGMTPKQVKNEIIEDLNTTNFGYLW